MKRFVLSLSVLALAACSSVQNSTRVSTSLRAQEFNTVASRYMEKPTFVSTESWSDGKSVLMVHMETYAVPHVYDNLSLDPSARDTLRHTELRFSKENVSGYVAAIDKFLEWSALATQRKDAFDKEISLVPTWANMVKASLRFTFHSGNEQEHFLVVAISAVGTTLTDQAQYFDVTNAKELKRLLLAFASDSLQKTDIDSVYR